MDINTVTQGVNDICIETGVCKPENPSLPVGKQRLDNGEPKIIYAAELTNSGKVVRVACYEDSCVTSCLLEQGKITNPCCHTAEKGGMDLTKAWVEHLKSNGYRVKEIAVED